MLEALAVTLCPGQSPFQKISQNVMGVLALPVVGQRWDLGVNCAFRAERGPSLLTMRAGHIHAQVPKLKSGVWPLLVLTLDPLPPKGLVILFCGLSFRQGRPVAVILVRGVGVPSEDTEGLSELASVPAGPQLSLHVGAHRVRPEPSSHP